MKYQDLFSSENKKKKKKKKKKIKIVVCFSCVCCFKGYFSKKTGFEYSVRDTVISLSLGDNLHENIKTYYLGKIRKY